jgi:hypothetical protein
MVPRVEGHQAQRSAKMTRDYIWDITKACPWRIRKLRRDRHLEQPAAMVLPSVASKDSTGGRRLARSLSRRAAIERLVNPMLVVIISERFQLSLQVDGVPDQHVVKKLPSYRPDQPFHKRMRHRYERDRQSRSAARPRSRELAPAFIRRDDVNGLIHAILRSPDAAFSTCLINCVISRSRTILSGSRKTCSKSGG